LRFLTSSWREMSETSSPATLIIGSLLSLLLLRISLALASLGPSHVVKSFVAITLASGDLRLLINSMSRFEIIRRSLDQTLPFFVIGIPAKPYSTLTGRRSRPCGRRARRVEDEAMTSAT